MHTAPSSTSSLRKLAGGALILAGIPLLLLPGPGLLLIAAGLGMLGWNRLGLRQGPPEERRR
jgi:hypothetical protein